MTMRRFDLKEGHTGTVMFSGWFGTIRACVEQAVAEGVCLDGVDLAGQNLACANLDDAQMAGACLRGANLNGANLSEAVFDGADFRGADLSHACLAVSSMMDVDFEGASFCSTDVTDAVTRGCVFSCPSVFGVTFQRAAVFAECAFRDERGVLLAMNKPPVTICGLSREIVYLDDYVRISRDFLPASVLRDAGMAQLKYLYGEGVARHLYPALCKTDRTADVSGKKSFASHDG